MERYRYLRCLGIRSDPTVDLDELYINGIPVSLPFGKVADAALRAGPWLTFRDTRAHLLTGNEAEKIKEMAALFH